MWHGQGQPRSSPTSSNQSGAHAQQGTGRTETSPALLSHLLVAEGPGDTHCPCASSQVPSWVAAIQPRTGPAGLSAALLQQCDSEHNTGSWLILDCPSKVTTGANSQAKFQSIKFIAISDSTAEVIANKITAQLIRLFLFVCFFFLIQF